MQSVAYVSSKSDVIVMSKLRTCRAEASFADLRQLQHFRQWQQCTTSSQMPPWVASVPRSTILRKTGAIDRLPLALRCRNVVNSHSSFTNLRVRSASTHVSPTAINLRPNIPPRNKELYDALSALSGAAETYVNISRLQLALRGLAAQDAVTRVAGTTHAPLEEEMLRLTLCHSSRTGPFNQRTAASTATISRPIGC